MSFFQYTICGNNIGALISALELGKKHQIALINPSQNWGAHFAGFTLNDENFDIGMNFFEFTTFHEPSDDLMSYNPLHRNDSARFFKIIEKYITSKIDITEVENLEILSNNIFAKDIVMTNSLDILHILPENILKKIRFEVEEILKNNNQSIHASQKKINPTLFLNKCYYEVSIANHGLTFHNLFIEPFCKKIFDMSSKDLPALLHRIAWAPLFYPETLLSGLNNKTNLPPTLFHYPRKGYFATIIESLINEIKINKNITIISKKIEKITKTDVYAIKFESDEILTNQIIWCNDLPSLLQTANVDFQEFNFKKASITVAFCFVKRKNIKRSFSTLYVSDIDTPVYRITNQEFSAKITDSKMVKLVLEFNFDVLNSFDLNTEGKIIEYINLFLINNNIINASIESENIKVKNLKNAVNLPIIKNYANFEKLSELTKSVFPEIELIGPASGFVSNSFNDQIIQALKIKKKYN